ncbi:hypothetical protein ACFQU7_02875 [Pseudoroseomonas wenyumeiae]
MTWRDAARLLWPQTVLGMAGSLVLVAAGGTAWLWGAPFLLPLLLAIPSASPPPLRRCRPGCGRGGSAPRPRS